MPSWTLLDCKFAQRQYSKTVLLLGLNKRKRWVPSLLKNLSVSPTPWFFQLIRRVSSCTPVPVKHMQLNKRNVRANGSREGWLSSYSTSATTWWGMKQQQKAAYFKFRGIKRVRLVLIILQERGQRSLIKLFEALIYTTEKLFDSTFQSYSVSQ